VLARWIVLENFQNNTAMTTSIVQKGQHFDNIGYGTQDKPCVMSASVRFNNSCAYNLGNSNQADWNKLLGFFDGYSPSYRSVRWAWRWYNNRLQIAPFVHHNNQMLLPASNQWIDVPLNSWVNLCIKIEKSQNRYRFGCEVNGNRIEYQVQVDGLNGSYSGNCLWDLFYFGGNETAPHDISIDFDNIATGAFQSIRLFGATQSWCVTYLNIDNQPATTDGGAGDDFLIEAKIGSLQVVFGDVKVGY